LLDLTDYMFRQWHLVRDGTLQHLIFYFRMLSVRVPVRIVVAYFAKLDLYGFWAVEELFTEFLRILEKIWSSCCCQIKCAWNLAC
jgi:hypothetical protein